MHACTTTAWTALSLLVGALTACASHPGTPKRPALPAQESVPLPDAVRGEALPLIAAGDYLSLGAEARRLLAWWPGSGAGAILDRAGRRLRAPDGAEAAVSPEMAEALHRLAAWYGLIPATLSRPITHEELRDGALEEASIARIADLFDDCIRRAVRVDGSWVIPEIGGEATLDRTLHLWPKADATWPTVGEIARRMEDPVALATLYEERAADMRQLDPHRLLKGALERLDGRNPGTGRALRMAVATIVRNAAEAYSLTPDTQFSLVVATKWHGRYVGRWHTHSPHHGEDGWAGGDIPSFQDMQNAVADGQFLTVVFQPEGFDLFDAAALGDTGRLDLSLLKTVRYRSPLWQERFAARHASLSR